MKYVLSLSLLLAALALVVSQARRDEETNDARIPDFSWSEIREIYDREENLDEQVRRQAVFRETLERVNLDLIQASTTLKDAADEVAVSASENSPRIIAALGDRFGAIPLRERIALMLLYRVAGHSQASLCSLQEVGTVSCLREELKSWTCLDAGTLERLTARLP